MIRATTDAPAPGQAARGSSNARDHSGGPQRRDSRLERTGCAARLPGGIAQRRSRHRNHRKRCPQPRSRRRRTSRGGMSSRQPPAGDTILCTAARRVAPLPVSAQSKRQLLGTRNARFCNAARRVPTTRVDQVSNDRGLSAISTRCWARLAEFSDRVPKYPAARLHTAPSNEYGEASSNPLFHFGRINRSGMSQPVPLG